MSLFARSKSFSVGPSIAVGAIAIATLALVNRAIARRTERKNPPKGLFIEVDGVRLHYTDRGGGSPVVLIHGNMMSGDDFDTSGVADALLTNHRVIIFDRPGFGHSNRPLGTLWTADKQADLLHSALKKLGIVRPLVVGHSWGAIVALAVAVRHEAHVAGVVAVSGYYFWTVRPDVALVGLGALPIIGDVLRYTVAPLWNLLTLPLLKRALFSPGKVADRFEAEFSTAMAVRPSQLKASAQDGALMIPSAIALRDRYQDLSVPVIIVAGEGDKIVFKRRAEKLKNVVPHSGLHIVKNAGHMVHYQATDIVVRAVQEAIEMSTDNDI